MISRDEICDLLYVIAANDNRNVDDTDVQLWQQMLGNITADEAAQAIMAHIRDMPGVWLEPGYVLLRVKAARRDAYERANPDYRDADLDEALYGTEPPRRDRFGKIDKSEPDDEDYPADWTPEQRLKAYWAKIQARRDQSDYEAAIAHPGSLLIAPPASDTARAAALQQFANSQLSFDDTDVDAALPYVNALLVCCPFCKSTVGDPCTQAGRPGQPKDKRAVAHPGRIEAAAVAAGHPEDVVKAIVAAVAIKRTKQVRDGWPDRLRTPDPIPGRHAQMPAAGPVEPAEPVSAPPPTGSTGESDG